MKTKLETFLAEAERSNYATVLTFYSANATRLGKKTADQMHEAIKSLSVKACWFMALAAITHNGCKHLGYENKEALYTDFLELMKSKNWKPQTLSSLIKTLHPFHDIETEGIEAGLQSLIKRTGGNLNARKKLTDDQEATIIELFNATGKMKTTHKGYLKKMKEMASKGLWKDDPISLSVVRTVVNAQKKQLPELPEKEKIDLVKALKLNHEDYGMSKDFFSKRYSS